MKSIKSFFITFIIVLAISVYSKNSRAEYYYETNNISKRISHKTTGWGERNIVDLNATVQVIEDHVKKVVLQDNEKDVLILEFFDTLDDRFYSKNGFYSDESGFYCNLFMEQNGKLVRIRPREVLITTAGYGIMTFRVFYEDKSLSQKNGIEYSFSSLKESQFPIIKVDYALYGNIKSMKILESPLNITFDYARVDGKIEGGEGPTSIVCVENKEKKLLMMLSKSEKKYSCEIVLEIVSEEINYLSADEYTIVELDDDLKRDGEWGKIYRSRDEIKIISDLEEIVIEKFTPNGLNSFLLDPIRFR